MNCSENILSLLGADKSQGIEFGAAVGFSVFMCFYARLIVCPLNHSRG
jgi:hypothetical protein